MGAVLRPFGRTDAEYAAMARINNRCTPGHWHVAADLRSEDEGFERNGQAAVAFCAWQGKRMAGMVRLHALLRYRAPGRRYLHLAVDPDYQGYGLGRMLYTRALAAMPEATELLCEIIDYNPHSIAIAEANGFVADEVEIENVCAVGEVSAERLTRLQAALAGIDVQPLSALKHLPDWQTRLHALYMELDADVPAPVEYHPISLEAYVHADLDHSTTFHDACFIARDGDTWIAMSELRKSDDGTRRLYQDLTGVRAPWRRRGIATGLKAHCVAWAQANGYDEIWTWNSARNTGMLAANRRVGFVPRARSIAYLKTLS